MAQWTVDEAFRAIDAALSDKMASDAVYSQAMQITFPDRDRFTLAKRAEGQENAAYTWDSTAAVSIQRAANRLSSDFTPPFQTWLEIGLGPAAEQMDDAAVKEALGGRTKDELRAELQNLSRVVQAVFNGPGFHTAANEMYLDWHFGQGGMKIMANPEPTEHPVIFEAMPLSSFYAREGAAGKLDQWFQWHRMRASAIRDHWPDALLPDWIERDAAKPAPQQVELSSVVYRDRDAKEVNGISPRPWLYEVFCRRGDDRARIVSRRFRASPFVTPRYSKLAGENRGRGPVLLALPDIRTANKIVEMTLRHAILAVAGVWTAAQNGIAGPVQIKPGAVIHVKSNGGPNGPSLQRLESPQRLDFGQVLLDQLHQNIRKVIGDNSLPPEAGPIRTATEFVQRARELISDQAGGLGRLHAEFVIPAVQRVIAILEDRGVIRTNGLVIDQFLIEVRMVSPLARGEQMEEVQNIARFVEILQALGGEQMVGLEINLPKATAHLGNLMGVPMKIRNTEAEKAEAQAGAAAIGAAQAGADPEVAAAEVRRRLAQGGEE